MTWPESGLERLVLHGAWQHRCCGCNEVSVSIPGLGALCRALIRALAWQASRLTAAEIAFLRKSLEMTGSEFADELRTSPASVSRCKLPAPSEVLLRLLVARRALTPVDVWGLLAQGGMGKIASEPVCNDRWRRATLLEGGDPLLGEDGPYWQVQSVDDEAAAQEAGQGAPPPDEGGGSDGDRDAQPTTPASADQDVPSKAPRSPSLTLLAPGESTSLNWQVRLTPREAKQSTRLPERVSHALVKLIHKMQQRGPVRGEWPNYGLFDNKEKHHCHLVKSRPTYVACWRRPDPKAKEIEIYYVGTHEKAPY